MRLNSREHGKPGKRQAFLACSRSSQCGLAKHTESFSTWRIYESFSARVLPDCPDCAETFFVSEDSSAIGHPALAAARPAWLHHVPAVAFGCIRYSVAIFQGFQVTLSVTFCYFLSLFPLCRFRFPTRIASKGTSGLAHAR